MFAKKEIVIISVGGSLIVPDKIDVSFLKRFKTLIQKHIKKGRRFVIITGGGNTARMHQNAAQAVTKLTNEDVDWLGIHGTRINAHLFRAIFHKEAHPAIITNPKTKIPRTKSIVVAAGMRPGASTDYRAVLIAKQLGVKKIVNLSNIDYVYTKDPRRYKNAEPIKEMTWNAFRKLLPNKWDPGAHAPFDPVAAKEAQKLKLEVAIINGNKLAELEKYLAGKRFKGTLIS